MRGRRGCGRSQRAPKPHLATSAMRQLALVTLLGMSVLYHHRQILATTRLAVARATLATRERCRRRGISTKPAYEGHIPLTTFENAFLAVGSAFMSLADPRRGGACCGCDMKATADHPGRYGGCSWRDDRRASAAPTAREDARERRRPTRSQGAATRKLEYG